MTAAVTVAEAETATEWQRQRQRQTLLSSIIDSDSDSEGGQSSDTDTDTDTDAWRECRSSRIGFMAPRRLSMHRMTVLAVMIAALSTACTRVEVPDVPEGVPVTYAEHLEPLVIARCLSCHTAEEPEAQLVLEVGTGYGQLVGRASVQIPELEIVVPGDLEASYLWRKLTHDVEIGRGMPRTVAGSIKLRGDELELYRRWIEGGAQP